MIITVVCFSCRGFLRSPVLGFVFRVVCLRGILKKTVPRAGGERAQHLAPRNAASAISKRPYLHPPPDTTYKRLPQRNASPDTQKPVV